MVCLQDVLPTAGPQSSKYSLLCVLLGCSFFAQQDRSSEMVKIYSLNTDWCFAELPDALFDV